MKLLAAVAVAFGVLTASAAADHKSWPPPYRDRCSNDSFRAFSKRVWDLDHWQRGKPRAKALQAQRRRLGCAPHPQRAKAAWRHDKAAFYVYRSDMLWLEKHKPFIYPDGTRWAAPYPVAWCESGGDYYVGPFGAYGLILEPEWQSPREQDEDAYRLLHTVGAEQAWFRWEREQGCPYL